MRRASLLIGLCLILALVINVGAAMVQRPHPEIMQGVAATRNSLQENIDGGDAAAAAADATALGGLFREAITIYESRDLEGAITIATKAAAAADEAMAAANAGNLEAAGAATGNLGKACGRCHMQFREKAADGSWQFKAQN
jgi:soluble cytochrome b562